MQACDTVVVEAILLVAAVAILGVALLVVRRIWRLVRRATAKMDDTCRGLTKSLSLLRGDIDVAVQLKMCELLPDHRNAVLTRLHDRHAYYKHIEGGLSSRELGMVSRSRPRPLTSSLDIEEQVTPSQILGERIAALSALAEQDGHAERACRS